MLNFSILCDNIVATFIDSYHFDPRGIYCQVTGKRIGTTETVEFCELIHSLAGDIESMCDDIAIRLLASLRPSLRWNKMRVDSLVEMRKVAPVDTLAYLLNRFFAPLNARKTSLSQLLGVNEDKIRLHTQLTRWGIDSGDMSSIAYMLLELDAKWGLDTEAAPFNCDAFIMATTHAERREMLAPYYTRRMKDWDAKVKHDEQVTRWHRSGNALAKPAFFAAFMQAQPLSETQKKAAAKRDEKDFFGDILNEVMGKPSLSGVRTIPEVVIAKPSLPSVKSKWGRK